MSSTFLLGLGGHLSSLVCLIESSTRSYPCSLSRIMIDIVRPPQMIFSTFPTSWQTPLGVLKRAVSAIRSLALCRCAIQGRCGGGRGLRWGLAESLGRRLGGHLRSLPRIHVRVEVLRRMMLGRGNWCHRAVRGRMRGYGWAIGVLPTLADGLAQVCRKVQDEFTVDDHVIVGLFEVAREHFCKQVLVAIHRSLRRTLPSPPASKSMTLPMRTLITPRKPWSFFLNFFWSKICTASTLSSVTRLPEC